jgi:hypothetical protein
MAFLTIAVRCLFSKQTTRVGGATRIRLRVRVVWHERPLARGLHENRRSPPHAASGRQRKPTWCIWGPSDIRYPVGTIRLLVVPI